uniref:Uncharacterized protein n=1 Tax=Cacopsylla melanoneura TaxID=428564 RepID=A0A8D8Y3F2_9HEMI
MPGHVSWVCNVFLTRCTVPPWRTLTLEPVDQVLTHSRIGTRVAGTFVNVIAAVLAGKAWLTAADKVIDEIFTYATISTRFGETVCHLDITTGTHKARDTLALVVIHQIYTRSTVLTGIDIRTIIDILLTLTSLETNGTTTGEASVSGSTGTSIETRSRAALVKWLAKTRLIFITRRFAGSTAAMQLVFTIRPVESRRTSASVRPLACVETGSAILTRLVIGAVVQILVAEQTAPAFITQALPGFMARAVQTAWVTLALITELAFPTTAT